MIITTRKIDQYIFFIWKCMNIKYDGLMMKLLGGKLNLIKRIESSDIYLENNREVSLFIFFLNLINHKILNFLSDIITL